MVHPKESQSSYSLQRSILRGKMRMRKRSRGCVTLQKRSEDKTGLSDMKLKRKKRNQASGENTRAREKRLGRPDLNPLHFSLPRFRPVLILTRPERMPHKSSI